jgi:hypothetical protein
VLCSPTNARFKDLVKTILSKKISLLIIFRV